MLYLTVSVRASDLVLYRPHNLTNQHQDNLDPTLYLSYSSRSPWTTIYFMAIKKTSKPSAKRTSKGKLAPRKDKRGLRADDIVLHADAPEVANLVQQVQTVGGAVIGAYREPLSGRPILVAVLPLNAVQPTPFQRDLSPAHTKRLAEKIEQSGSFLDPLIVVRGEDGNLWTPNGRHRLAAAKMLGLRQITALVSPDEDLAFRILALNTEKAHNLKDRSKEVIRIWKLQ